ncbi:hypothetical protein TTHERM_00248220 (macronuclear) [Tetrahymena thermophila SB210]|uniref:Uncharacterized protein n=1 Tax=Tetrahymena thermophila (strain SB210) TaxID=312017 RepID=Q245M6_TETTS|nr:hypothetical protein TTHERM_00248220 [Tetrahymena thermophila SB210]EAS03607.2 hypothetical protein TTHERM_00248220 [Tetrahymena thermophila SB210]|eukprot:XP_001023852.2 hypothetical protein TTHERM_00248220 [Tetrahymena thermophila SB210]
MTSNNTTYATYVPSKDCPYQGPYKLDLRCRYYYQPTVSNISTQVFAPSLNFGSNGPYYSSNFCQRRVDLSSKQENDIFSILCITLNLQVIPVYFQNFGQNSKFQMLIDPQTFSLVYNSQTKNQSFLTSNTIMQVETDYLQDKSQAKIFLGNLTESSNFIMMNSSNYQFNYQLDTSQKVFEYNRNGTDCFVLLNIISMVDKVPRCVLIFRCLVQRKFVDLLQQFTKYYLHLQQHIYLYKLGINFYYFRNLILLLYKNGKVYSQSCNPSYLNTKINQSIKFKIELKCKRNPD